MSKGLKLTLDKSPKEKMSIGIENFEDDSEDGSGNPFPNIFEDDFQDTFPEIPRDEFVEELPIIMDISEEIEKPKLIKLKSKKRAKDASPPSLKLSIKPSPPKSRKLKMEEEEEDEEELELIPQEARQSQIKLKSFGDEDDEGMTAGYYANYVENKMIYESLKRR